MIVNRKHTGYSSFVLGKCDLCDDDHLIADDRGSDPSGSKRSKLIRALNTSANGNEQNKEGNPSPGPIQSRPARHSLIPKRRSRDPKRIEATQRTRKTSPMPRKAWFTRLKETKNALPFSGNPSATYFGGFAGKGQANKRRNRDPGLSAKICLQNAEESHRGVFELDVDLINSGILLMACDRRRRPEVPVPVVLPEPLLSRLETGTFSLLRGGEGPVTITAGWVWSWR